MTLTDHIPAPRVPTGVVAITAAAAIIVTVAAILPQAPETAPQVEDWHGNVARSDTLR